MIGWQAWQITVDVGRTVDLQHVPVLHQLLHACPLLQILPQPSIEQNDILHSTAILTVMRDRASLPVFSHQQVTKQIQVVLKPCLLQVCPLVLVMLCMRIM